MLGSIGIVDTAAQADESTELASSWVRDEKPEKVLPNAPRITSGEIVAYKTRHRVQA